MDYPIRIRLELEEMRYHVLHAMQTHHEALSKHISEQLDAMIETFDFEAVVRAEVERVLPELIRQAVQNSLREIMWSQPIKSELDAMVNEALGQFLKERIDGH